MAKYIDAEKLIAEIERLVKVNKELKPNRFTEGIAAGYGDVLSAIASLQQEQLDVEFEDKFAKFLERKDAELGPLNIRNIANHFYKLGLNTRKEE